MPDFKLLGSSNLTVNTLGGKMTEGIGFPLRSVELGAATTTISAADVTFNDPLYPNLTNVRDVLLFLLLVSRETTATFTNPNLTPNRYLDIGGVSSEFGGWLNTGTAFISKVTVVRSDTDFATLELLVNGAPVMEFPTSGPATAFGPFAIPLQNLDMLSVRNKAGSPKMEDVVFTATVKQVQE